MSENTNPISTVGDMQAPDVHKLHAFEPSILGTEHFLKTFIIYTNYYCCMRLEYRTCDELNIMCRKVERKTSLL